MTTKTTGAEWNAFYADDAYWPDGAWHDDEELTINGTVQGLDADLNNLPAAADVVINGGVVYMDAEASEDAISLETHFKRWRKATNTVLLVCAVPRELETTVRAAIAAAGGKVR
jgi:hypothetical protein